MDKKLSRTIGYVKPELRDEPKKAKVEKPVLEQMDDAVKSETASILKMSELIAIQNNKSKKIVKWINSHKKFKWGLMCDEVGMDRGNFQRLLKSDEPTIKVDFIDKIEENLKQYGYE